MFKNFHWYRLTRDLPISSTDLEEQLEKSVFNSCGDQELSRIGWVKPLGKNGASLSHCLKNESIIILSLCKQEKILPASVIKDFVSEKVEAIEAEEDRKIHGKERASIKDDVIFELSPQAFSRFKTIYGYLDLKKGLLFVDSSTAARAEEFCSYLRKTLGSLPCIIPQVKTSPSVAMTSWLQDADQIPQGIVLGDKAVLAGSGDSAGVVRYKEQDLLGEEIASHLQVGKQVTELQITLNDTLSAVISDDLSVKGIRLADIVTDKIAELKSEDPATEFDASMSILVEEFSELVDKITACFGGEVPQLDAPQADQVA